MKSPLQPSKDLKMLLALSEKAAKQLAEWKHEHHKNIKRPNWDEYFLKMAHLVASRSHDAQSQFGSVIVGKNNEVLSTGYNGLARNLPDKWFPNLRPEKYPWMIHSEHNAILNCARNGVKTEGATLYISGSPCIYCLQYAYQAGIKRIIYDKGHVPSEEGIFSDQEQDLNREIFIHSVSDFAVTGKTIQDGDDE